MSITFGRPVVFKTAALAVFAAFTALFLAYVDLYLVFDEHVFRTVSRDFWQVYNFTYIAFFVVVVTVLATAVCLALVVSRGEASNIPNQRAVMGGLAVLALISVIAWWLFFTVHGFGISVVAVLTTLGLLLAVAILALKGRSANAPYQYSAIPAALTVLAMLGVVALTITSYVILNTVAPVLFNYNQIELLIVLGVMVVSTLGAAFFMVRAFVVRAGFQR